MRKSLLILCALVAGSSLARAESIQHLADSSFQFQVQPEYRIARLPSVLESVRDSQVDLIDLQPDQTPRHTPVNVGSGELLGAPLAAATDETRENPLRPKPNVSQPDANFQSPPVLAANPNIGPSNANISSRRTPTETLDESTRLQRLVSALDGTVETQVPEFPAAPPFTNSNSNYGGLKPSMISPAPSIGSLKAISPTGVPSQIAPLQQQLAPTVPAPRMQSDGSVLGMIANRSLLQGKTPYRTGLIQLQALALRYEQNVRSSGFQVINKRQLMNFTGFWNANESSGQPLLDESTHRIYVNYLQGTLTSSVPTSTNFQLLKADLHTTDSQLVQAVARKLDAVASVYWQLVEERGKLVAATDHAKFCETVLSSVGSIVDTQPDNLYTQARAAYDRSLTQQNEAFSRTVAAQLRLVELVGNPSLMGKIELIPTDLPKNEPLTSLQKQLTIANANRDSTMAGAYGVNLDIQMAHRQLTSALQQVNRSLQAVSDATTAIAEMNASLESLGPSNALTLALNKQARLCESQFAFLEGLTEQQLALTEMKRANGTLIHTEYLRSNTVATIDLSTPEAAQSAAFRPTSALPTSALPTASPATQTVPAANASPQTQTSKWEQKPIATSGPRANATSVANPFAVPVDLQPKVMLRKRSPVNRTTSPRRANPQSPRTSSSKNRMGSSALSWLSRLTGAK